MKKFAFLTHPLTGTQLKEIWPLTRVMPDFAKKLYLKSISPFKISEIKNIRSIQGEEIGGYLFTLPLVSHQIAELSQSHILDKINAAVHSAEKLGARILGLGGMFTGKTYVRVKKNQVPVANGNFFTAWTAIEAVHRIAKVKNLRLENSAVTIIGASGTIGSLCARELASFMHKIIITGGDDNELSRLAKIIDTDRTLNTIGNVPGGPTESTMTINLVIEKDTRKAIENADFVVVADNSPELMGMPKSLKPGSVVCDISPEQKIVSLSDARKDITFIRAGLVKLPSPVDSAVNIGLPENVVSASMAETMLLTFEDRLRGRYLSDNTDIEKLEEIANIAVQHGFETWLPEAPVL